MLEASTTIGLAHACWVLSNASAYCVLHTAYSDLRTANVQASVCGFRFALFVFALRSIYLPVSVTCRVRQVNISKA
jgi:hypothetical protein